jgi:predicted membrane-bound spermidine synthase
MAPAGDLEIDSEGHSIERPHQVWRYVTAFSVMMLLVSEGAAFVAGIYWALVETLHLPQVFLVVGFSVVGVVALVAAVVTFLHFLHVEERLEHGENTEGE